LLLRRPLAARAVGILGVVGAAGALALRRGRDVRSLPLHRGRRRCRLGSGRRRGGTSLSSRGLRPRSLGWWLVALLGGRALRSCRGVRRGLRSLGGSLLCRTGRGGWLGSGRRRRPFGRRAGLAAGSLGSRTIVGPLCAGTRSARWTLTALLGCSGSTLILSALPALLTGAPAAFSVLSLPSLTRSGRQLFIGCRSSLSQNEGWCWGWLEGRDMRRQQHQGKGGTRKKQTGKLHDPQFIVWRTKVIDNDKLPGWFRERRDSAFETEF
jgi:hypothetical protein